MPTQENQPHSALTRAAGLFAVLIVARLLTLDGSRIPISLWTAPAYLWQDVAAAMVFAIVDYIVRRDWFGWTLYGVLVGYVALNVPIARVLSSPLTLPMIRATGGPLSDSIRYYITLKNVGAIALVTIIGAVLPIGFARWRPRRAAIIAVFAAGLAIVAPGPYAISKVDTAGRYRNALGALWPVRAAGPAKRAGTTNWRTSPFPPPASPSNELLQYRGSAAGRNVVIVSLESAASRYWPGFNGMDPMPNLTAFADRVLVFEHAYAVYPESIKGLFSVLCSRYPAFNVPAETLSGSACVSFAGELGKAGYRTALFHSGRFMYLGMPAVIENRGFEILEDAGAIGGEVHSSFGVDDQSTVKRMLEWIDSLKPGERFFVTYLPVAGHHPYATPKPGPFVGNDEFGRYLNALHYGDEALGQLLDGLHGRRLDNNTLFIFFGDHGEAFGQHEGNFGHTLFIYGENIHVPYIIAAPGLIREKLRIAKAVSLIDTAPTILDLLGLPIPPDYEGTTMLDPQPRMSLFFTDYSLGFLGLYDSCWKYIFETNSQHSKIYDVCKDPDELRDLSGSETKRAAAYRSRLEEWFDAIR